ncbi:MAG: agmatinase family protein [Candidatus Poribacteria bacterium]|nr:agmatinase family protein [Candidatus Poribacteria bacterium]
MSFYKRHAPELREHDRELPDRSAFQGMKALDAESTIPDTQWREEVRRGKEFGLEPADSIVDKTEISVFQRGELPHWSGINTFLKSPYLEDVRQVGEYDVAVVGAPFDIGTTYRSGTRFGPQGIRRISSLYTTYNFELGVDLRESLKIADVGDIFCPSNITKAHDQITKGVAHILSQGTMPVIMGGDHSIGYPCARGVAEVVEGKVGIIHLDRHIDTQERDMDEIMHTCPWFHATNLPNCPPANLVQVGIGGWQVPRPGVKQGKRMGSTVMTIGDIEKIGIEKTIEMALEVAWKGASAVYLSFDIDSVDCGFVPGTGWPEPGGFLPREALAILQGVAKEGVVAMEVVEVAPPYDISDITALLGVRAIVDVLATMVKHGRIGGRL